MNPTGPIEPEGIFDGLSGGAIAIGALIDLGASIVVSALLLVLASPGQFGGDEAAAAEAVKAFYASGPLAALDLALGLGCTVFGAFLAARRAGRLHVRHGGWVAVASTALFACLALLVPSDSTVVDVPFWYEALSWILILPCGVAGGAIAEALEKRP